MSADMYDYIQGIQAITRADVVVEVIRWATANETYKKRVPKGISDTQMKSPYRCPLSSS